MKEAIKEILAEFQKEPMPTVTKRDIEISKLPPSLRKAFVFIGMSNQVT